MRYTILTFLLLSVIGLGCSNNYRHKRESAELAQGDTITLELYEYTIKSSFLKEALTEFVFDIIDSMTPQTKIRYAAQSSFLEVSANTINGDSSLVINLKTSIGTTNYNGFSKFNGRTILLTDTDKLIKEKIIIQTKDSTRKEVMFTNMPNSSNKFLKWIFSWRKGKMYFEDFFMVTVDTVTKQTEIDIRRSSLINNDTITKWSIIDTVHISEYSLVKNKNGGAYLIAQPHLSQNISEKQILEKSNSYLLAQYFGDFCYDSQCTDKWMLEAMSDNELAEKNLVTSDYVNKSGLQEAWFTKRPKYFIRISMRGDLCNLVESTFSVIINGENAFNQIDSTKFYRMLIPVWDKRLIEKWDKIYSLKAI